MKVLVGIYRGLDKEVGVGAVVTYPADRFPYCVSYLFQRDVEPGDYECNRYINSEEEWHRYADEHFGKGNWEIRDMEEE